MECSNVYCMQHASQNKIDNKMINQGIYKNSSVGQEFWSTFVKAAIKILSLLVVRWLLCIVNRSINWVGREVLSVCLAP